MDNRDPIAVFGVEAANAIMAAVERVDPRERVAALKAELDDIDPKLFLALNARTSKMLHLENGLTDMAAAREALRPIFANYLQNTFIKLYNGDQTALEGLCGACSGNSSMGSFLDDFANTVGKVVGTGANAVKNLACKIAPMASTAPDPRVAGGAAIANNILCGSGSGGGMSQQDLLAFMAAQEAQRKAEQQRTMLLIGGGVAAVLLVVALK